MTSPLASRALALGLGGGLALSLGGCCAVAEGLAESALASLTEPHERRVVEEPCERRVTVLQPALQPEPFVVVDRRCHHGHRGRCRCR